MKGIPFLLSINFRSNQIILKVMFYLIGFCGRQNKEFCNGWVYKAEERRREREKFLW